MQWSPAKDLFSVSELMTSQRARSFVWESTQDRTLKFQGRSGVQIPSWARLTRPFISSVDQLLLIKLVRELNKGGWHQSDHLPRASSNVPQCLMP
ncbi:hypothetical protein TNCV_4254411 [Trichonephila clavipes]|nr:hypothetical protein TNCV_4254411 [Trichonephila clavipes]